MHPRGAFAAPTRQEYDGGGRNATGEKKMSAFTKPIRRIAVAALVSMAGSIPALAATFVYVSNADDGDISTYGMKPDGELVPGPRVKAGNLVMPMAVSPDRRFLYASVRS